MRHPDLVLSEMVTHAQLDAILAGELVVAAFHQVRVVPRSASSLRLENLTFLDVEDVEEDTVELHCVGRPTNENPALTALLARVAA